MHRHLHRLRKRLTSSGTTDLSSSGTLMQVHVETARTFCNALQQSLGQLEKCHGISSQFGYDSTARGDF